MQFESQGTLRKMKSAGLAVMVANRFSKSGRTTKAASSLHFNPSSKQSTIKKQYPVSEHLLASGPQGRIRTGLLQS